MDVFELYDFELERVRDLLVSLKPGRVLLQLPDGLKPYALSILSVLESFSDAEFFLWGGSCFGACDFPFYLDKLGFDLLLAFGHAEWS